MTAPPDTDHFDGWIESWPGAARYLVFAKVGSHFESWEMGTPEFVTERGDGDALLVADRHGRGIIVERVPGLQGFVRAFVHRRGLGDGRETARGGARGGAGLRVFRDAGSGDPHGVGPGSDGSGGGGGAPVAGDPAGPCPGRAGQETLVEHGPGCGESLGHVGRPGRSRTRVGHRCVYLPATGRGEGRANSCC